MTRPICLFICLAVMAMVITAPGIYAQGLSGEQPSKKSVNIGIVSDGSTLEEEAIIEVFKKEIVTLLEDEYTVRFPGKMILSGEDTVLGVQRALNQLFAGADPEIILALGVISASEVLSRNNIPKPVIAPYIAEYTLKGRKSEDHTSGIENFAYINSLYHLNKDIPAFRKIVPFKHVTFVFDQREVKAIPDLCGAAKKFAEKYGLKVSLVAAGQSASGVLKSLPAGVDAVLVGPLWHFSQGEKEQLAQGLIERMIPGFAVWDREQVELGLLAGLESGERLEMLARRTAVAVMDILLGEKPAEMVIEFERSRRLTINMATARKLNIYPGLLVMTGADLINEQRLDVKRELTLPGAVAEAITANLSLRAAISTVNAGKYSVNEAMSALLPRIEIQTGARAIDRDLAALSGGVNPERAWMGTAGGSIPLYSDRSWSNYLAEEDIQESREMDLERVRLDVTYAASAAYLNVLRAQTVERIYKENLKLTQANLERAEIRVSTGAAGPDEVYRWEAKYAIDSQQVIYRESDTLDAMEALNRILHRPIQELSALQETNLQDPLFIMGDKFFFQLMENPGYLKKFQGLAVGIALRSRPELKGFEAAIKARDRLASAATRSYWLPDFSVEGKVDQYFYQDGAGQRDDNQAGLDDTDWTVGVYARIPIFEGGRKGARAGRLREEANRLRITRDSEVEIITQDVFAALNRTRASSPSISLSRDSASAARRNLELVTESYIQGIKSIIDLLDAQNSALSSDLDSANSVYNFLVDLMGVERAIGEFVTFMPEVQRKEWYQAARTVIGDPDSLIPTTED